MQNGTAHCLGEECQQSSLTFSILGWSLLAKWHNSIGGCELSYNFCREVQVLFSILGLLDLIILEVVNEQNKLGVYNQPNPIIGWITSDLDDIKMCGWSK